MSVQAVCSLGKKLNSGLVVRLFWGAVPYVWPKSRTLPSIVAINSVWARSGRRRGKWLLGLKTSVRSLKALKNPNA